jgi:3-hydroxyacyl-[acyl-carrier-protein] dehydratase
MEFDEIRNLLPQKFPFLMLDRVVLIEEGKRLIAIKNITGNDIFFLGHFPNKAVMPGALLLEGMAQAAIILFQKSGCADGSARGEEPIFFFGSVNARFLHPVIPGDQLQIEVNVTKMVSTGGLVNALASVEGQTVAKAELGFGVKRVSAPI